MKLRKIISAVCAFAMTASMVTVANAAALGGNVKVTATFAGYEIDTEYDNQIVARIDFKLDSSAAEELSAYASTGKGSNKVETGNGVTTAGISWTYDSDFEYWDDTVGNTSFTLNSAGNAVSFGPKTAVSEYLTDSTVEFSVRYAVYDNDATGSIEITGASLNGKNTTEGGTVWAYHTNNDNIDVVGCSIPSYNTWVAGDDDDTTPTYDTLTQVGDVFTDGTTDAAVAYMQKFAGANGSTINWALSYVEGGETKTGAYNKAIPELEAAGDVYVGIIVQYDPTVYSSVAVTSATLAN